MSELLGKFYTTFTNNHNLYLVADYSYTKQEVTLEVYEFIGSVPKQFHHLTWLVAFVKPHEAVKVNVDEFTELYDELKRAENG